MSTLDEAAVEEAIDGGRDKTLEAVRADAVVVESAVPSAIPGRNVFRPVEVPPCDD
jgi:hypothetical protein